MTLLLNKIYRQDVESSLETIVNINDLNGKSILITGASGLIGSSVIDQLLLLNEIRNFNIKIFCCGRKVESLEKRFGRQTEYLHFVFYDATEVPHFDFAVDYISTSNNPLDENYIGTVDHLSVRSSYASSKRATETLCASFASEYGIKIMIVRPGHIYGPSAKNSDNRVSSFFMTEAIAGRDIVMKSTGSQLRSYCYSLDCASAILSVLLSGESGQAYNVSNPNSIVTIKQMAEIVSRVGNVKLTMAVPSNQDIKQTNPMQNASLRSDKLEGLGWQGLFSAEVGFQHTFSILKELSSEK